MTETELINLGMEYGIPTSLAVLGFISGWWSKHGQIAKWFTRKRSS